MSKSKKIKRNILLNPGPATTSDTVKYAQVIPDICPRETEFGSIVKDVRKKLLRVVNGEKNHSCIPFASSGTGGVEACLASVVPKNKKILILSNGAYAERIKQICEANEILYIDYNVEWGSPFDINEIENIIEKNINVLSCISFVHHETSVGILNKLKDLCCLARKHSLECIVDAMSSFSGIPIDVEADKVDYLISSSNKCVQGMAGISFVIARNDLILKKKEIKRNYYFNLYSNYISLEEKQEFLFTPPVQVLYALHQALIELFNEGLENRYKRYEEMYKILINGLKNLGFKLLVEEKYHSKLLTTVLYPESKKFSFEHMHDYFYKKGITIYPGKIGQIETFRLANIGHIYPKDISYFLNLLAEYNSLYQVF